MEYLLTALLRASVYGSIVIGAILLLRLTLRKAPKKYICLLWLLAALRLLMPFEIESSLSLQPEWNPEMHAQSGSANIQQNRPQTPAATLPAESQPTQGGAEAEPGVDIQPGTDLQPDIDLQTGTSGVVDVDGEAPGLSTGQILCLVWLMGACGMLTYSGLAYCVLRRRVRDAVVLSDGVWVSGKLDTAFVLGYFRPGIYLNAALDEGQRNLVLRHEACHIRRGDHWWKLLGYATLAVHWFNPLVWVGYIYLCRDLEMACDEAVVRNMDVAERKAYSAALLGCGVRHRSIAACPVAFGEVSVKARIKNVLHYRKPSFWIVLVVIAAILAVGIFLLTSPVSKDPLEICREAFEKLQTSDGCVIRLHTPDSGDPNRWPAHETVETWASGDNWYSCYTSGNYVEEHLQYEGRLFIRQTAPQERDDLPYREWTELTAEEAQEWGVINRLKSTVWEEHSFVCQENTDDGKYALLVDDKYTWTFTIEEATNAITSVHSSFYNGEYEHTADTEITYPGKETVAEKLELYFLEATGSWEWQLERCRLALEEIQNAEQLRLWETRELHGTSSWYGWSTAIYLYNGDNLYRDIKSDSGVYLYLFHEGQLMVKHIDTVTVEEDNPWQNWTEIEFADSLYLEEDCWVREFDWNEYPISVVSVGEDGNSVTLRVERQAEGLVSHTMQFQFDAETKALKSALKIIQFDEGISIIQVDVMSTDAEYLKGEYDEVLDAALKAIEKQK